MKTIVITLVTIVMITTHALAQTSTVSIARKKLYSGSMGAVKIFIDGELSCELKNNSFAVHQLPSGKHKFSVQWSGKKSKDEATDNAIEIDLKPGQQYYLRAITEEKGLKTILLLEEVTANAWPKVKQDLDLIACP